MSGAILLIVVMLDLACLGGCVFFMKHEVVGQELLLG
jgi:hypothetical protein